MSIDATLLSATNELLSAAHSVRKIGLEVSRPAALYAYGKEGSRWPQRIKYFLGNLADFRHFLFKTRQAIPFAIIAKPDICGSRCRFTSSAHFLFVAHCTRSSTADWTKYAISISSW